MTLTFVVTLMVSQVKYDGWSAELIIKCVELQMMLNTINFAIGIYSR